MPYPNKVKVGDRFGRLAVVRLCRRQNPRLRPLWECHCDCGTVRRIPGHYLTSGDTRSCGCLRKEVAARSNQTVYPGEKYGRITVVEKVGYTRGGKVLWRCKCECGRETSSTSSDLHAGHIRSCGCLRSELTSTRTTKIKPGQRYGRLVILRRVPCNTKQVQSCWECQCDCGSVVRVSRRCLQSGHTKSCGCLLPEWLRNGYSAMGHYDPSKPTNRTPQHYRSRLELKFMKLIDNDARVESWSYETSVVEFVRGGKKHRTVPDFIVAFTDGKRFVCEVKGAYFLSRHLESGNYDAVRSWSHDRGMAYVLWTERGWLWHDQIEGMRTEALREEQSDPKPAAAQAPKA